MLTPSAGLAQRLPSAGVQGRAVKPFASLSLSPSLWYAASDISTLALNSAYTTPVEAHGDPVGGWRDKSGNGYGGGQDTASKRPLYQTNVINGLPALLFDGVDDELNHTLLLPSGQPNTTFVVAYRTGGAAGRQGLFLANQLPMTARTSASVNWGTYQGLDIPSNNALTTGWKVACVVCRSFNDVDLITDGAVENKTTGTAWYTNGAGRIGSSGGFQFFAGYVAEIVAFNRALSVAERNRVGLYLAAKYGLTWAA